MTGAGGAGGDAHGALVTRLVEAIPAPGLQERQRLAALGPADVSHEGVAGGIEALQAVEDGRVPGARPAAWPLEVAFWNVERGRRLERLAARLATVDPAAALLCELDLGMARTEQQHTTRVISEALGAGYVYGVEFVELGLGDPREQAAHAGQENAAGLHGAAIVSRHALERPALVRLELDGHWFGAGRGEPRVGGRIAVLATLVAGERRVVLGSVHLESHGNPHARAAQMRTLLGAVERYAPGADVLLGGDFNTQSAPRDDMVDPAKAARLLESNPGRLLDPVSHEPLFEVARTFGYEWTACNVAGAPTTRLLPHHPPTRPLFKLDWFFARGLAARGPRVVEALDPDSGDGLSDHEMLVVTLDSEVRP